MVNRITLSLITAAAVWAQAPQPPRGNLESRLTRQLGLNATQQNTLHTALAEERSETQGLMEQRGTLQQDLIAAIKSGNSDQIDAVTQQLSSLDQQRNAIHSKTLMKLYSTLTADQKTTVGPNLEMLMGPGGRGMGPGRRPGSPPPPQN